MESTIDPENAPKHSTKRGIVKGVPRRVIGKHPMSWETTHLPSGDAVPKSLLLLRIKEECLVEWAKVHEFYEPSEESVLINYRLALNDILWKMKSSQRKFLSLIERVREGPGDKGKMRHEYGLLVATREKQEMPTKEEIDERVAEILTPIWRERESPNGSQDQRGLDAGAVDKMEWEDFAKKKWNKNTITLQWYNSMGDHLEGHDDYKDYTYTRPE